ncbi:MAG: SCO family protein [Chloroflexi bacterium]|nr:MAG: SCO family protein [Chloroflexota bacterium]
MKGVAVVMAHANTSIRPRFSWIFLVGVLVVLAGCGAEAQIGGNRLEPQPAPDFTLVDQRGNVVQLSNLRGTVVVLTFIYTNCPDICPLIAQRLRATVARLPDSIGARVTMLAVTVDPARDTPAALQAFSETHGLANDPRWHALTGDPAALEAVWDAWSVNPAALLADDDHSHSDGTPTVEALLGHSTPVFVIDRQGRERTVFGGTFDPKVLAETLEALAR